VRHLRWSEPLLANTGDKESLVSSQMKVADLFQAMSGDPHSAAGAASHKTNPSQFNSKLALISWKPDQQQACIDQSEARSTASLP
jgi:hypothetical protein